ncbi:MAG: Phage protein [Xylanivirga thermophila]|jgi:hypothetical protein|uniref:hypothetical protein n=1 Tax=Xylanivirga thermophila TaxID=2496273 RepID=UPI00101C02B1|nr:hypothetical protein [Xylanivirga thermophila]
MKYVYAILTVIENNPIMQTYTSNKPLTGRQILDEVILTQDERIRYRDWTDEKKILEDMNKRQSIRVEIQEVEV